MNIFDLPPRDLRSLIALLASICGSMALTAFSAILVFIVWKGGWPIETAAVRVEVLSKALMLSLAGSLVVLITLGFVINRRSIKVSTNGFEAVGGQDENTPVATTTTTTTTAIVTPVAPVAPVEPVPPVEPTVDAVPVEPVPPVEPKTE